jgi:RNA polymerase sigma-70 factor (ECF subfamily)
LLDGYDRALPEVYGYLLRRCGRREVAEDLAAETFLAAAAAARRDPATPVSVAWLIGTARHKLADHWRRAARDERNLHALTGAAAEPVEDPWDVRLDALQAHRTLAELGAQHRLVLTLRYVDDLPVADVAELLGRTVHATEALLVRARRAFRARYPEEATRDD